MRGVQGNQHERSTGRLLQCDSVIVHLGWQLTVGQLLARLREQQIRIGIRLEIEINEQCCLLVRGGVQRVHVTHVVHAADLLLDGHRNGLLKRLRICTRIVGLQPDLRRSDLRELRYRQSLNADRADYNGKNRNHDRDDRSSNEKVRHGQRSSVPLYGVGFTSPPSLTLSAPTATTRSPGFRPEAITQRVPTVGPTCTVRSCARLSPPTTMT